MEKQNEMYGQPVIVGQAVPEYDQQPTQISNQQFQQQLPN